MNKKEILIMGIGNYLMGDEGIGVHAVQELCEEGIDGVDFLDGGTGGFYLLEYFEQYSHVILVDATLDGLVPGNIRLIKPKFASDFPQAMSTHDIGLKDLISALQLLGRMPEVYLFVMSIRTIQQQGIELTDEIRLSMNDLKSRIRSLIDQIKEKIPILV